MVDHVALTYLLIDLAGQLVGDYDVGKMLHDLCVRSTDVLPILGAGVMLQDGDGHLRFVAASDETVGTIETLQVQLGEGPCLVAFSTGEQVVATDLLAAGQAFPTFAERAVQHGLQAVHSFPMRLGETHVGALNVYHADPSPFSEEDRAAAQALADVATTAIINVRALEHSSRLVGQLQHALDSRIAVEQAKGVLSERLGVPVGEAFEVMRRHARSNGRRLQQVAREVLDGQLDLDASGQMADGA